MSRSVVASLTEKWFHSVDKSGAVEWKGQFLELVSPGLYLVQLYELATDTPTEQLLVPAVEMRFWKVYGTREEMEKWAQTQKK
jgi:hypothetical protein